MIPYPQMDKPALSAELETVTKAYEAVKAKGLKLDMSRGKPGKLQLDLSNDMLKVLSDREIEVMNLIVQGFINKEIAEQLNIALSTVVTHRRNIMEKLGVKSVSALTIYAVTHGYVDISKICCQHSCVKI